MAFELQIAVKHGDVLNLTPGVAKVKTLVFDASGTLSHEGAVALANAIEQSISPEFCGYVIRFNAIDHVDADALLAFAQWVRGRRGEGIDVRLCALEPSMHKSLEDLGEFGLALVPPDRANDGTARRIVDVRKIRE